jgi:hypothetical protein
VRTKKPKKSKENKPGRVALTVGLSLFPIHREWLQTVKRRIGIGPSAYMQALLHSDMRSGGEILAKALAIENKR